MFLIVTINGQTERPGDKSIYFTLHNLKNLPTTISLSSTIIRGFSFLVRRDYFTDNGVLGVIFDTTLKGSTQSF